MIRVGVIGYGYAGSTFHAPLIANSDPELRLAAVSTRHGERVRERLTDVEVVDSPEALLARDVDLVVVATPNDTHFTFARQALNVGKHVVVDKPFTLTAQEASSLSALAQQRRRVLSVFQNRRWDGDFLTVRELAHAGTLGRIVNVESHFDRFRPEIPARWREEASHGGGLLYDLGSHLIDQALALFGKPHSVNATLDRLRDGATVDDYIHVQLEYDRLQVVLQASALSANPAPRFSVHGTRGSYVKYGLDVQEEQLKAGLHPGSPQWGANTPGTLTVLRDQTLFTEEHATAQGCYERYYQGIVASIRDGVPPPVMSEEAVLTMRVLELARRSAAEGRALQLE